MPFDELLGHSRIIDVLRSMLANDRMPHALLFAGPRGVGKFTLARMLAQAANCERLKDDFCGECETCKRISLLADPGPLVEAGLAERGESADASLVERMPLLLETHPDVWAIVPDPVRLKTPVARPVIRMGQLRAAQRAAYFKPVAKRRFFIIDGAETMQDNLAGIFLKILEEPPETSTFVLLTTSPYRLLPTIRSRSFQFSFERLETPLVEAILRKKTELKGAELKKAAQLAEGRPGVVIGLDMDEALSLRADVLKVITLAADGRNFHELFQTTSRLAKGHKVPFESILELFYSFFTDLLELSAGCADLKLRNPNMEKELAALARRVDTQWVMSTVKGLDELETRLRRNVSRQLGLETVVLSSAHGR